jgi:hypothetical protein
MKPDLSIKEITLKMLEPYTIPEECPYLSEEQKELSKLPYQKRMEWMAEWLMLAAQTDDEDEK